MTGRVSLERIRLEQIRQERVGGRVQRRIASVSASVTREALRARQGVQKIIEGGGGAESAKNCGGGGSDRLTCRNHPAALECAGAPSRRPLKGARNKKTPLFAGACLCPIQRPSSGAGAGLWVWLRSRAACDRQS